MIENQLEQIRALLERLVQLSVPQPNQQAKALDNWREQNAELSNMLGKACDPLAAAQRALLEQSAGWLLENKDSMDSEFLINEFTDRFGSRLQHLNSAIQIYHNLGSQ
jgi:hypothetical protein